MQVHEDKKFDTVDYSEQNLSEYEFTDCEFEGCNFSKTNLTSATFMNCKFKNCNLALANLKDLGLKDAQFTDCKLMGLDFSVCNNFLFAVGFEKCQLDYATFYGKSMRRTKFIGCSMKDVDFTEVQLSESIFTSSDLNGATFARSVLEKADFRLAKNYIIDPEQNKIKKAKFSTEGIAGLLANYNLEID